MTDYIITEDMLKQWRGNCINLRNPHTNDDICKMCKYRGTGSRKGCCDFDDNHMEDIFRSRPLSEHAAEESFEHGRSIAISDMQTQHILNELKRRYWKEAAILDYIEMIECEVKECAKHLVV